MKSIASYTKKFINNELVDVDNNLLIEEIEILLNNQKLHLVDNDDWHKFLDKTSRVEFLTQIKSNKYRTRWAEIVFKIIQHSEFSLNKMFSQRVDELPGKILFQDWSDSSPLDWTYERINIKIREFAAVFYSVVDDTPRVALYNANSVDGACCDLACLFYNIFDTPLNIHFNAKILINIFDRLKINIAVADTSDRLKTLQKVREKTKHKFVILTLKPNIYNQNEEIYYIEKRAKKLNFQDISSILSKRKIKKINQVATTMFTSGSTGEPKGVSFSTYNLVSKRFARHAAVPKIGNNEVLLCYLPLYHTFGRYLELLGAIYWRGTYVFTGNSSTDILLSLFPIVNPSIFISVPLRWQQLYERIIEKTANVSNNELLNDIIKKIAGNRLKWGLSAAGYLSPKVFRFFQKNNIELCSGFGMTEATGGITMTPPGIYKNNSTGFPLPGTYTRLRENNELLISGHYITMYLEQAGPDDIIPYPVSNSIDNWLPTGDIFEIADDGHFQIIDRVKDIYKNNKGQTIAPRTIEKKFTGVPGIKQTFLVGDAKPYNVLLIVPDYTDPVLTVLDKHNQDEYFHQIVMSANKDTPPYERIVNFAILNREFTVDKGELTPKGSFNRKTIESNFKETVEKLYISNHVRFNVNSVEVIIPRWFYRDLGILETDIELTKDGILNRRNKTKLKIKQIDEKHYQIGDLIYESKHDKIDIGRLIRQPRLWIGNPEIIAFSPVKEGWDLPLKALSDRVIRCKKLNKYYSLNQLPIFKDIRDQQIVFVNNLISMSLFSNTDSSYKATEQLGHIFRDADNRLASVIRRRLEALSTHQDERTRVLAYRILLLNDPEPDYDKIILSFLQSGLSFLNEESIKEIALNDLGKLHLETFRQRLFTYRAQLNWPIEDSMRTQFSNILKLLYNFARRHIKYYTAIRSELASWILHKSSPSLSKEAEIYFNKLYVAFENYVEDTSIQITYDEWTKKIIFESGISNKETKQILKVFSESYFLQQSVMLAFDEFDFSVSLLANRGIWITRIMSFKEFKHYRISINTTNGKHFDLHFVLRNDLQETSSFETTYWMASIAGHPYGTPSLPTLGCSRASMGIRTSKYINSLNVWEKIREYSEIHSLAGKLNKPNVWRNLFIKAMSVFFETLRKSGYTIIPGIISPNNVVVSEMYFQENATIITITGWEKYASPYKIFQSMLENFFCKTIAHYPWHSKQLEVHWIFDACIESLGKTKALVLFDELLKELEIKPIYYDNGKNFATILRDYIEEVNKSFYYPLALFNAIDQYNEWYKISSYAKSYAKLQTIFELSDLYKLNRFQEVVRFYLFRNTYFSDSSNEIKASFDILLEKMQNDYKTSSTQFIQLSDLQDKISNDDDKEVFSKMVFPRLQKTQSVDILRINDSKKDQIIVQSKITDNYGQKYNFREPLEPSEVGQLYKLFYQENYPKTISKMDKHFVITDSHERVIGGLCYKELENNIVLLDGSAITSSLQGRGIGSAMVENFFSRMLHRGVKMIKAHFLLGNYYLKHNFTVNKKWGALIRYLE